MLNPKRRSLLKAGFTILSATGLVSTGGLGTAALWYAGRKLEQFGDIEDPTTGEKVTTLPFSKIVDINHQNYSNDYSLDYMVRRSKNTSGRCVHCATIMLLGNLGLYELADKWARSFDGGEYSSRHCRRMDEFGIQFAVTTKDNRGERFLDWACANPLDNGQVTGAHRGAGITLLGSHVLNLTDMDPKTVKDPKAKYLNNWTKGANSYMAPKAIQWPRQKLISDFKKRGEWAFTILGVNGEPVSPPPPRPFIDKKYT